MTKPPPTSPVPVDTGKVAGRRMLRFESIDQAMAEVERLAETERAGRLRPRHGLAKRSGSAFGLTTPICS